MGGGCAWREWGQITRVLTQLPLESAALLLADTMTHAYGPASEIISPGYATNPRGNLTSDARRGYAWDAADRLVGMDGVTLGYNGLGDLVGRIENAVGTLYDHADALGLSPMVAERDGQTGAWLRFYVYAPWGELLYLIETAAGNRVLHYHFDHGGNTLFLTDPGGGVTDAYAYTPYGRLVARNGTTTQPFTFVGKWGIRQVDPEGSLYHMRARAYDASTGRFLSRDPLWPVLPDPHSLNPYPYANNNPVNWIDVTGLNPVGTVRSNRASGGPPGCARRGKQTQIGPHAWIYEGDEAPPEKDGLGHGKGLPQTFNRTQTGPDEYHTTQVARILEEDKRIGKIRVGFSVSPELEHSAYADGAIGTAQTMGVNQAEPLSTGASYGIVADRELHNSIEAYKVQAFGRGNPHGYIPPHISVVYEGSVKPGGPFGHYVEIQGVIRDNVTGKTVKVPEKLVLGVQPIDNHIPLTETVLVSLGLMKPKVHRPSAPHPEFELMRIYGQRVNRTMRNYLEGR